MDAILQGVMDVPGVGAAMVFDGAGQLAGHRGHAVYDRSLCEGVSGTLLKAIETVQLQQEDWERAMRKAGKEPSKPFEYGCRASR